MVTTVRKTRPLLLLAIICFAAGGASAQESAVVLPRGFVHLSDVAPTIEQDLRYATRNNFTGAPVDGYEAGVCILTRATAEALARAQRELERINAALTLKVLDCYRPVRAVRRFRAWVEASGRGDTRGYHHPNTARRELMRLGYISGFSSHSRGNTVDITLASRSAAQGHATEPSRRASCLEPAPLGNVDMGTDFDCFDPRARTRAAGLTPEASRGRQLLLNFMRHQGFRNYWREWWHFDYPPGDSGRAHDFVIRAPVAKAR